MSRHTQSTKYMKTVVRAFAFAVLTAGLLAQPRQLAAEEGASAASPALAQALTAAINDEFHARDFYRGVLNELGEVRPFSNIVHAEERHAAALGRLFERYGLVAPAMPDTAPPVLGVTLGAACRRAVEAERENVALYDRLLTQELPDDVRAVFSQLRRMSLERHQPAFERCGGGRR